MDSTQWDAVAAALRTADFPANRQDLLNHARQQSLDAGAVAAVSALPVGVYRNLVDVRDGLKQAMPTSSDRAAAAGGSR